MANAGFKAVVRLQRVSLIKADQVVNTWYFRTQTGNPPTDTEMTNVAEDLEDFYWDTPAGGTRSVGSYLGAVIKRTGTHPIDFYTVPDVRGPLGVPIGLKSMTPSGGPGGNSLFAETACVLSYHGAYEGTPEHGAGGSRPKATWRGRIYLGPLTDIGVATDGSTNELSFNSTMRGDIGKAAHDLYNNLQGHGIDWKVFSVKNWQDHTVEGGWVDDAPDTQRRRGQAATVKTAWTAA